MKTNIDVDNMMRGRWVEVWHPSEPGGRVRVWRPWWKKKSTPEFATPAELKRGWVRRLGRWTPMDDDVYFAAPRPTVNANVGLTAQQMAQMSKVGQNTKVVNINGRQVPLGRMEEMGYLIDEGDENVEA